MGMWRVEFRAGQGMGEAFVQATTMEEAEEEFRLFITANEEFGVAVRVTPVVDAGSPAPVA